MHTYCNNSTQKTAASVAVLNLKKIKNMQQISEQLFGKMMASNESWTMAQVTVLGEFFCE